MKSIRNVWRYLNIEAYIYSATYIKKQLMKFLKIILILFSTVVFSQNFSISKVDSLFKEYENTDDPGASLGIIKDGKLIYKNGYGSADLEHNIPLTEHSVFNIASITKQFVAFSILLLEEQGKLNLEDPIQKHLPDFPKYASPITLSHLIHHTSGLRDSGVLLYLKGINSLDNIDPADLYKLIKSQKELNFPTGEEFSYSNSGYFLLVKIIEKVSGKSIDEFGQHYIFKPLGMSNTVFYNDNTKLIKNRVFSYHHNEYGEFENQIIRSDIVGPSGIYTTIEDIYLWDQNFYDNKLGKGNQEIIDKMQTESKLNDGKGSGYSFGQFPRSYKGYKTISHGGDKAGFKTQYLRVPELHLSIIIFANRDDIKRYQKTYQILNLFIDKVENNESNNQIEDSEVKITDLEFFKGAYELQPGIEMEITIENKSLKVFQKWDKQDYLLKFKEGNTYIVPEDNSLSFTFLENKFEKFQKLEIKQDNTTSTFKRLAKSSGEINFNDYVGNYYSEELDTTYTILIKDSQLVIEFSPGQSSSLLVSRDRGNCERLFLEFTRKDNVVNGFKGTANERARNIVFRRITH